MMLEEHAKQKVSSSDEQITHQKWEICKVLYVKWV